MQGQGVGDAKGGATAARVVAAVALGANLGDPERTFKRALARLERVPGVVVLRRSRWHVTAPVGGPPGQPDYLNGVVLVETTLGPRELLAALHEIEAHFGRTRREGERDAPRTLDLDLLFHGDARVEEPGLVVPHPRLEERLFVLEPLAELAPARVLASSGKCVADRVAELREAVASAAAREAAASPGLLETAASAELRARPVRLADPAAAEAWCRAARSRGATIGFVPTMGALHEGHLELVRRAARENDLAVASVFVNPLQFDDARDLARYPRDFERDAAVLAGADCAMVFTGTLAEFFPGARIAGGAGIASLEPSERVAPGPAAEGLEGEHRPGHFDGVATIVARLLALVAPERAYFGQKDFQQTLVVRDLAARTGGPAIVVCPTSREPDGLARSSRNALLDPAARVAARALSRALIAARAAWRDGERDPRSLAAAMEVALGAPSIELEYAEVRDPGAWTAAAPARALEEAVALVAAKVGGVRLIDNSILSAPDPALDALHGGG